MKIFFVFFISCLALALAETSEDDWKKAIEDCRKDVEDQSNMGCVYHCAHKKLGFMNDDDSIDLDKLTGGQLVYMALQALKLLHQQCVSSANGDSCKVALCVEQAMEPVRPKP